MRVKENDVLERLNMLKKINTKEVNIDDIVDISTIIIKKNKSSNARIISLLEKVENPYIFKVDGTLVKFVFSKNNIRAKDSINRVIKELYK